MRVTGHPWRVSAAEMISLMEKNMQRLQCRETLQQQCALHTQCVQQQQQQGGVAEEAQRGKPSHLNTADDWCYIIIFDPFFH